jgi:antitoxin component YwqK of YwqJK toxin-antitoxin module
MATLTEIKTNTEHYFEDESGKKQGEFKWWHDNGQLATHCVYVDDKRHGEYKWWNVNGELFLHCFYVDDKEVIDFFKDPDLCPVTDEVKTYFALKYGSGKWLP